MLRPRSYGVKLVKLTLSRFLFQLLAIESAREDAAQRVGKLCERIRHAVEFADSLSTRKLAVKLGLAPIVDGNSRVLILGTLPGDASLRLQRYYSHGRNDFWTILARVFDEPVGSEYGDRVDFLRRHGIALWDVLKSAERRGSLDTDIKNAVANDFARFFSEHPNIKRIGLNGTKADALFRQVVSRQDIPTTLQIMRLPSTSPTPGKNVLCLDQKASQWRSLLTVERARNGEAAVGAAHVVVAAARGGLNNDAG